MTHEGREQENTAKLYLASFNISKIFFESKQSQVAENVEWGMRLKIRGWPVAGFVAQKLLRV